MFLVKTINICHSKIVSLLIMSNNYIPVLISAHHAAMLWQNYLLLSIKYILSVEQIWIFHDVQFSEANVLFSLTFALFCSPKSFKYDHSDISRVNKCTAIIWMHHEVVCLTPKTFTYLDLWILTHNFLHLLHFTVNILVAFCVHTPNTSVCKKG